MVTRIDKAIVAGFLQAVSLYGVLVGTGAQVDPLVEVAVAIGAGIVAGVAVWRAPNKA